MKSLVKKSLLACFSVCISMASFQAFAQDMSQHKHQNSSVMAESKAVSHDALSNNTKSHDMDHSTQAMKMMAAEVVTSGVVKGVLANTNQLKVHHQAIPEWSMAEMQMKYHLAPGLSAADFSEDQQIKFRLHQENMMKYTIIEILNK